jgi:hypothetical protein
VLITRLAVAARVVFAVRMTNGADHHRATISRYLDCQ